MEEKDLFTKIQASDNIPPILEPNISFTIGQIVRLSSNPEVKGAIVAYSKVGEESLYSVFMDGSVQSYYESQLKAAHENPFFTQLTLLQFNNLITAIQLINPGVSTLYSLNAARIDFIPYQFRPVLKFIRSDRPRLLIADGVGVGKTIEAGLILRELQARRSIKSILIICPRPLVTERKWEREMKRFDEKFTHLDGGSLRYCINEMDLEGEWPEQYARVIMPFSLFDEVLLRGTSKEDKRKRKVGLLDLDPPPRFDLVIVDEAHHIRNADTIRHQVVSYFCDHAEAVVFLTATPIQIGNQDLFVLLKILRPDVIIDKESFQHLTEPNTYINKAIRIVRSMQKDWATETHDALVDAADTAWGSSMLQSNPDFQRVVETLNGQDISNDERIELIRKIESFHTLSGIINRTRRKDIKNFTIRKVESVYIPFTPQQKRLHDAVLSIQEEILRSIHSSNNVKFMLTTIRRQTASCIFGLKPFLKTILTKHIDELEIFETENIEVTDTLSEEFAGIASRTERILKDAGTLEEVDPKFDALLKIIKEKQLLPNNRVMLFSTFRHTLSYLYTKLQKIGFRVGLIHGGIDDDERRDLRLRFELSPLIENSIDLLLFSEVGCEGLDYQFCDCMVNYDLPWNPMRIEQRIGRIDRNGQKSECVLIYNLITPDTIDAEIYERCLLRIGVFTDSIGDCEEILGEATREIQNIGNNYLLTAEEQNNKLQQIADNQIRLYQEQELLEAKQFELFGINISENSIRQEIDDAHNNWISQQAIQGLVHTYLQKFQNKELENILGIKDLKTLRLAQEIRNKILADYLKLPQQKNSTYKEWEKWLKGDDAHLQITFSANCAKENAKATFLTVMHPLVLQAAYSIKKEGKLFVFVKAHHEIIPAGIYEIAIYQWRYTGIKESVELKAVSTNSKIAGFLMQILETAKDWTLNPAVLESYPIDEIQNSHYELWVIAKEEHLQQTEQMINFRKESLQSSHNARIALLSEQLFFSNNARIAKMREAQIFNAGVDFIYRMEQLKEASSKADIIANPVVFGIINIEN